MPHSPPGETPNDGLAVEGTTGNSHCATAVLCGRAGIRMLEK